MNTLLLTTFGTVLSYAGYILLAILILLLMITVHEFGHYIVGKIFGFGIDEFAIGFGPKIFKKTKKSGEIFSIRAFPLGGFCSFRGEDDDVSDPTAFNNKKPWQRILVLVAGPLMNYLLALILVCCMFGFYGPSCFKVKYVYQPENYEYSLQEGDVILSANDVNVYLTTDLMKVVEGKKAGDEINFTVIRDGKVTSVKATIREDANVFNVEDLRSLLLSLGTYKPAEEGKIYNGLTQESVRFGFFDTIGRSFEYSFKLAGTIFTVLGQLLTGKLGLSAMGGTITTITTTASAIQSGGVSYLLYISSFIGVNLAVFNLLPFPALDGARIVFNFIEWVRKKPISRKVEGIIHTVGFVVLLCLAVIFDLQHCF